MIQIIPAILATSEQEYQSKLTKVSRSNLFEWIQVDFMDGQFVPNISIGVNALAAYPTSLKIDAHLMVVDPINWVDQLVRLGIKRFTFHIEAGNTQSVIDRIRLVGLEVGLALNPNTVVEKVVPFIDKIDTVLLMSVEPGFGGQQFLPQTMEKVKELAKLRAGNSWRIGVDGGINDSIIKGLVEAGVDNLFIAGYLFNGNITENFEKIWQSVKS